MMISSEEMMQIKQTVVCAFLKHDILMRPSTLISFAQMFHIMAHPERYKGMLI